MMEVLTPNQILEAIKYAKSMNPDDKEGDGAFRINLNKIKTGNNNVRYLDFEVLKKRPTGKWEYVNINLKFMNLTTRSRIYPAVHEKRKFPGIQLQFAHDATYSTKVIRKLNNTTRKEETVIEEYGRAKILIAKAFIRLMTRALKEKKIFNDTKTIFTPVQFYRIVDEKTKAKEELEKPIIRINIRFKNNENDEDDEVKPVKKPNQKVMKKDAEISPNAKPACVIYDANKKIEKGNPNYKEGELNYELAKFEKDGVLTDLIYDNIGEFILPGSSVSGVDCFSVSISSVGISLASKVGRFLIVKPSKEFGVDPTKVFSKDEINSFNEAETQNLEESELNEVEENKEPPLEKDEFDDLTKNIENKKEEVNDSSDLDDDVYG